MFLPMNITETTILDPVYNDDGEVIANTETAGYSYDEYRINKAVGLPEEASAALADAFQLSVQALKILGVM